jgi:hypothetical protein
VAAIGGALAGRRVQIAGSASASTDISLVQYGHTLVASLVPDILNAGGGLVLEVGKEPRPDNAAPDAPSLVFNWTALEAAFECIRSRTNSFSVGARQPIVIVSSEKAEADMPETRRALFNALLGTGRVRVESIMPGSRAAAFIRQRQSEFGDVLVCVGGGTGVEHLADLYLARRRAVVPLDLEIGASRHDGTGGSVRLAKQARAEPDRFIRLIDEFAGTEGAALAQAATRNGASPPDGVVQAIVNILTRLARSNAFYVRLLNAKHPQFALVESFFRNVVDHVVDEMGMTRVEVGTDRSEHAFMNVAIFERLHFSSVAIVDVTGERPNCFIELGYALGNNTRVLVTAQDGTSLPFDQQAIPCHFWHPSMPDDQRKQAFREFWEREVDRPAIVPRSL